MPTAQIIPMYCGTREAARRLGYAESLDTFYDHLRHGWIAGAERHGESGPGKRPRYRFRVAELGFRGPVTRVVDEAERAALERRARLEATGALVRPNPFRYSRRARA